MILSKVKTDKNRGSRRWVEEGVTGGDGRSGDAADEERRWSEVNEEERSVGSMFGERERERERVLGILLETFEIQKEGRYSSTQSFR